MELEEHELQLAYGCDHPARDIFSCRRYRCHKCGERIDKNCILTILKQQVEERVENRTAPYKTVRDLLDTEAQAILKMIEELENK